MSNYLLEFADYFFPALSDAPVWLQVFVGLFLVNLLFKFLLSVLGLFCK